MASLHGHRQAHAGPIMQDGFNSEGGPHIACPPTRHAFMETTMSSNLRIDGARLVSRLTALSAIGATPEGGCRRLALSDEDKQGRDWLVGQMQALGLDVKID